MANVSQNSESAGNGRGSQIGRGKKRMRCRTGCWNCRRKRRKCKQASRPYPPATYVHLFALLLLLAALDFPESPLATRPKDSRSLTTNAGNGKQPICEICSRKGEVCQWGIKISFRPENSYSIPNTHPSMRTSTAGHNATIEFCDITHEIIRDYQTEAHMPEGIRNDLGQGNIDNDERDVSSSASKPQPRVPYDRQTGISTSTLVRSSETDVMVTPGHSSHLTATTCLNHPGSESPHSVDSTESLMMLQSAAAQLLDLGCAPPSIEPVVVHPNRSSVEVDDEYFHSTGTTTISPATTNLSEYFKCDDGIFLPGSTYLELHSALRNRIFDTARSTQSCRDASPRTPMDADDVIDSYAQIDYEAASIEPEDPISPPASTPLFAELEQREEYKLWKNWVDEIAPWLDKFDNDCHFGRTLPIMAQDHRHLRCSMLALSARQQERKHPERRSSASLALYQEAVHQLIPQLQTRSTAVVASCVVLCVLEMMSCSPNMWRRHLDGCASLIQSVGINGFSVGLEKALFWCFARMDVCGGFISSQHTLIPIDSWSPETSLEHNVRLYRESSCFHLYADYSVFLCALVLDLFASYTEDVFARRWSELFVYIEDWYAQRPPEMRSILELHAPKGDYSQPFPVILFSNPAAVSGNQLYHTAALLMLQRKPRGAFLRSKPRSILWHARRICAISISNTQHACWTNCIQPLWIAGKLMSHPSEHQAILDIYATIEKDTGWGAKWRADDLKNYWGDLDG
ncbi:hypothetical protein F4803DRAFT_571521 [Xylaria telfairii]|nr:hypothetical protein F4803DRAFT_571521 [Xylaria telfairii]